jgi:putative ABC transport system permease protein
VFVPVVSAGRQISAHTVRDAGQIYVGTPQLLAYLHVDVTRVDPQADVLTSQVGPLEYVNVNVAVKTSAPQVSGGRPVERAAPAPPPPFRSQHIATSRFTTPPTSVITTAALARQNWQPMRLGWLVESRHVLTAQQVASVRAAAVPAGLIVEVRQDGRGLATIKSGATAAGVLLALLVLAMTVGLIRSEAGAELRTLSATGAPSRVRRGITASTAAAMGGLGVLVGATVAYLALLAAYRSDLSRLSRVPVLHLTLIAVGVPVLAYAGGWLFAAREPKGLARHALD